MQPKPIARLPDYVSKFACFHCSLVPFSNQTAPKLLHVARRTQAYLAVPVSPDFGGQRPPLQRKSDRALGDPLHGETRDLARILKIQLFLDVSSVRFHRFGT